MSIVVLACGGPLWAQNLEADGGFQTGEGRWLSFRLPAIFPRFGSPAREYRAAQDVLRIQVYPLKKLGEPEKPETSRPGASLDGETERLLSRFLEFNRLYRVDYSLGNLKSRKEVWGDRAVVRVENVLPDRVEQLVFLTLNGETYAFAFRPRREMDLEETMKMVILSARHSTEKPVLSRTKRPPRSRSGLKAPEVLLLHTFGKLLAVLLLLTTVSRAADKAYDVCRARRRVSVRESLRIFWNGFGGLLVVSGFYVWMVYERMSTAGDLLQSQDLTPTLIVPGLLLLVMCAAFAVIGARVGFHRSKRLSRLGANLGLLLGLATAYQALKFVLV